MNRTKATRNMIYPTSLTHTLPDLNRPQKYMASSAYARNITGTPYAISIHDKKPHIEPPMINISSRHFAAIPLLSDFLLRSFLFL